MEARDWASPELPRRLERFLRDSAGRAVRVENMHRFSAGMSWITFGFIARFGDPGGAVETLDLILRIGDAQGLLAPYSAEPEFCALEALSASPGLPIPRAYWRSDDEGIIGAPFIITQRVEGETPLPWKRAGGEERDAATDRSLGCDFVDALAIIHGCDWTRTAMAKLAQRVTVETVARHETARWSARAGLPRADAPPQMHYAMRWLEANAQPASRIRIVHGDYRVGNFLALNGRITAILDWELVHLGDPHEDLAWAALRAFAAGTSRVGGLIDREAFFGRYEEKTGWSVDRTALRYYEILGLYKQAAMLIGAIDRAASGRARDYRMAAMGFQLTPTLLELNRLIGATR
jgi:aminoglycoside phosphotransferase (APT) family kinase protein